MLGFSCRAAKISFAVAFVIICISAVCAQAQGDAQKNAVLNSPYLAKAGACMNNMTAAGKSAGFETDRDGGAILIKDPKNEKKLGEILSSTFECLDNAFGMTKKKIDRRPGSGQTGTKSWIWYASVAGMYIWCASDGDSVPDHVGPLGGNGPKKDWNAIALNCSIGNRILGWYSPELDKSDAGSKDGQTDTTTDWYRQYFNVAPGERNPKSVDQGTEVAREPKSGLTSLPPPAAGPEDPVTGDLSTYLLPVKPHSGARMNGTDQDWIDCAGNDPERAANACDHILVLAVQKFGTPFAAGNDFLDSMSYRAAAFFAQRNFLRAIGDYGAIIDSGLDIRARLNRAIVYSFINAQKPAIVDYAVAERIDSKQVAELIATNRETAPGAIRKLTAIAELARSSPPLERDLRGFVEMYQPVRPTIGVSVTTQRHPPDMSGLKAGSFNFEQLDRIGMLVTRVTDDGPAQRCGIQVNDVIVKYDDESFYDVGDLPRFVASTPIGKAVEIVVLRNGKEKPCTVTFGPTDVTGPRPLAPPAVVEGTTVDCAQAATHWKSAEAIGTREVYEDHLKRFPNCAFAILAKARLASLEQKGAGSNSQVAAPKATNELPDPKTAQAQSPETTWACYAQNTFSEKTGQSDGWATQATRELAGQSALAHCQQGTRGTGNCSLTACETFPSIAAANASYCYMIHKYRVGGGKAVSSSSASRCE